MPLTTRDMPLINRLMQLISSRLMPLLTVSHKISVNSPLTTCNWWTWSPHYFRINGYFLRFWGLGDSWKSLKFKTWVFHKYQESTRTNTNLKILFAKISRFHNIPGSWTNGPYFLKHILHFTRICLWFSFCPNYGSSKIIQWKRTKKRLGIRICLNKSQNKKQKCWCFVGSKKSE